MKSDSSFNPDPLQNLLANAFAVQESGITSDQLVDLVDLQHSIETGAFDPAGVMQQIAERARTVAQASGTAIASLVSGQLVYQAATGTMASYLGRRVIATLTNSNPQEPDTEILRVENADTDLRLQAAICRQFEAKSLLMLPVLCDHELWGVFQIFFNQPHEFSSAEVRLYHLLRNLLADAISVPLELLHIPQLKIMQTSQLEGTQTPQFNDAQITELDCMRTPQFDAMPDVEPDGVHTAQVEPIQIPQPVPIQIQQLVASAENNPSRSLPLTAHSTAPGAPVELAHEARPRAAKPTAHSLHPTAFLFCRRVWDIAVGAVAIITVTILFLHQNQTAPIPQAHASNAPAAFSSDAATLAISAPSQAQSVASDEVIPHSAKRAASASSSSMPARVRHFGTDATIRYFTATPVILRSSSDTPSVRHLSDDVTIRYFKPTPEQ